MKKILATGLALSLALSLTACMGGTTSSGSAGSASSGGASASASTGSASSGGDGTYTIGTYLVDAYCMGVKQSIYKFNIDKIDYERIVKRRILKKVPYPEIHNLVYGAVEFAREAHAMQAKNFTAVTQYILEEDTDDIPYIEYEFGKDGKHFFCADDRIALNAIVPKLCENLGADNVLWAQKLTDTPKLGSEFKFIPPAEKEEKKEETEIPEKWRIPRISLW